MRPFGFPAKLRLRERAEFMRALRGGLRVADDRLIIWCAASGLPHPRLGLMIGRRLGGAVQRNRLKRLLREGFRLARPKLPAGVDLVCTAVPGAELTLAKAMESLERLSQKAARRMLAR